MKARKMIAFPNSGNERNRVLTSLLILGIALILLSGLSTLRILSDFKFTLVASKSSILKSNL